MFPQEKYCGFCSWAALDAFLTIYTICAVTLLVLFLVKSGQKQCDHSDLDPTAQLSCLPWRFIFGHRSVDHHHSCLGRLTQAPIRPRLSCCNQWPLKLRTLTSKWFYRIFRPDLQPPFLAFLGISRIPQKFPAWSSFSPWTINYYVNLLGLSFLGKPSNIPLYSHYIPITLPLYIHFSPIVSQYHGWSKSQERPPHRSKNESIIEMLWVIIQIDIHICLWYMYNIYILYYYYMW